MSETTPRREEVLHLIREERARQIKMYGTNDDLEMGFGSSVSAYPWLAPFSDQNAGIVESYFRADYERYTQSRGKPTWMHLIREEVAELFEAGRHEDVIDEAVQVAALCTSLVEHLLNKGEFA